MKFFNYFLLSFFTFLFINKPPIFSQLYTGSAKVDSSFYNAGQANGNYVGIGTNKPNSNLHIYAPNGPSIYLGSEKERLAFGIIPCDLCAPIGGSKQGDASIHHTGRNLVLSTGNDLPSSIQFKIRSNSPEKSKETKLEITSTGQVLIGINSENCTLPIKGILGVNGGIYCTKLVVKNLSNGCFPDYVFEKDYKLRSLQEVEDYIDLYKHLPEVPSEKELEKTDIDVAEMDAILLKKIEELTLYVIELEKKIKILQVNSEIKLKWNQCK